MQQMSRLMRKPTICIGENKGAYQLRGNREADQRLCFRYSDSTIPLLLKFEISSFQLFSVLVQAGLCRTWSETTLLVFSRDGSNVILLAYVNHCIFTAAITMKAYEIVISEHATLFYMNRQLMNVITMMDVLASTLNNRRISKRTCT